MRNLWPKIHFKDKRVLFVAVPALLLLAVFAYPFLFRKKGGESYRTAPVKRTDILANISASGTLEPEQVIDVGAQVAGRIVRFGADSKGKTIDYGSPVERGTALAQSERALAVNLITLYKALGGGWDAGD